MNQHRIIDYYILIRAPGHPREVGNGYVPEQILIAEKVLGRDLTEDEEVRHVNGNTQDNRPENLEIVSMYSGYKVVSLTDSYFEKPRKLTTKNFIPCKYQQICWKTIRSVKAKKLKCYLPYICSYQSESDIYNCPIFWDFMNKSNEEKENES